ncbi:hypothetical protein HDV00_006112 [Rhizophlyctis rosea]|nr:hypothetical protein HDV00_006112 [Rhizophlyctis rosea]
MDIKTNPIHIGLRPGWAVAFLAYLFHEPDTSLPWARAIFAVFPGLCKSIGLLAKPQFMNMLVRAGRAAAVEFVMKEVGWREDVGRPGVNGGLVHGDGVEVCVPQWSVESYLNAESDGETDDSDEEMDDADGMEEPHVTVVESDRNTDCDGEADDGFGYGDLGDGHTGAPTS